MIDLTMKPADFVNVFVSSKMNGRYVEAVNYEDLRKMMWDFLLTLRAIKAAINKEQHVGLGVNPDDFDDFLQERAQNLKYCSLYRSEIFSALSSERKRNYEQYKEMIDLEKRAKNGESEAQEELKSLYYTY